MVKKMNEIVLYDESMLDSIQEIFFLSTSIKTFESAEKKAAFFKRWCGDYITFYPDFFYVMRDCDSKKVLGYLSGCLNSQDSLQVLSVPGHALFSDLFIKYPAHLHINFHPDCRGLGLGGQIVEYFVFELARRTICGLHLITSPDAKNISFYKRLQFSYEESRLFGKSSQLFMGRNLC